LLELLNGCDLVLIIKIKGRKMHEEVE